MELIVGICDDDKKQIELIKGYLVKLSGRFNINIISSTKPFEFFHELDKYVPDLLFLDIDMEEMDGIKLGKKIKEKHNETIIIYITAYEKYALEAFRVRAFHYLLKPLTDDKFSRVFREAISQLEKKNKNENKYFMVKKKGEYININYDNIYYFEKVRHKVKICTKNGEISFYGTFKKLLHELDMDNFIHCHQGYIVNISKIRAYRDQMLLMEEKEKQIPVSRSHIKEVKEMMKKRLFD